MDLNGDGVLDLVSGRYSPPLVSFFEGTANGFRKSVFIEEVGISAKPGASDAADMYQCAAYFADLDGDGDHDMVVGCNGGQVYVNINTGSPKQFKFGKRQALMAGGKPMKVAFRSDPTAADWDGDGVLDLLVGDESCGVTFYKGIKGGTGQLMRFEAGVPIVPGKEKNLVPGYRARPAVVDWNNDGKLDLLVGNCEPDSSRGLTGHVYLFLRK